MEKVTRPIVTTIPFTAVRGNEVKNPHKLNFSFYFSTKDSCHSIRVKPVFAPSRMQYSNAGNLDLHTDWEFMPERDDRNVDPSEIQQMKEFFRKYFILFSAVWDSQLPSIVVKDYFEGKCTLNQLIKQTEFYSDYSSELDKIKSIEDLEEFCRDADLVDLHGN